MKKLLALALVLAMSASMLAGCGGTPTPSSTAPAPSSTAPSEASKPAEPELPETGKLTLYAAALEDECIAIGKAFEEKTGIKTNVVVLGGGEILARVQAESSNATASVWWGGGCDGPMNAKEKGLLA